MEKANVMEYVSFMDIMRILKRSKEFIILVTILCTCIMVNKVIFFSTPIYKASSTTILVKANSSNAETSPEYTPSDINLYQQVAETYVKIADSDTVINKTVEELKTYTPEQLRKMVSISRDDRTQIIQLSAESSDPKEAANIVEVYCKNFIEQSMSILPVGKIQVLDSAKVPTEPVSDSALFMIVMAFAAGLLGAIGIVLFRYYVDSRKITSEKQITSILNIPVLASID